MKIAHIINPFEPKIDSDLFKAQALTMQSMIKAKNNAPDDAQVSLYAVHFEDEDVQLQVDFERLPYLEKSVQDKCNFTNQLRLPLISEILKKGTALDADYIIYTNIDITIMPHFYSRVAELVADGTEGLIINRRRISERHFNHSELDKMELDKGLSHPGFDCFVIKNNLIDRFELADICIGVPYIGIAVSQNMFAFCESLKLITDEHLTYHIGLEIFKKRAPKEYVRYNRNEFHKVMKYLLPITKLENWPYSNSILAIRLFRTLINPSVPIRWRLKAEWSQKILTKRP